MPCNAFRNLVNRLDAFACAVCSATHTALARDELCTPPNGQSIDPVRKVASRSRTIDFQQSQMSNGTILVIILILALVGVFPTWGHSRSWGYGPSGIVGLIVVILIVLLLLGKL